MLRREDFLMIQSRVKAGVYQEDIASSGCIQDGKSGG